MTPQRVVIACHPMQHWIGLRICVHGLQEGDEQHDGGRRHQKARHGEKMYLRNKIRREEGEVSEKWEEESRNKQKYKLQASRKISGGPAGASGQVEALGLVRRRALPDVVRVPPNV